MLSARPASSTTNHCSRTAGVMRDPPLARPTAGSSAAPPGQRPKPPLQVVPALHRPRHGDRLVTEVIDVTLEHKSEAIRRLALEQMGPHPRNNGSRCLEKEVGAIVYAAPRKINL